MRTMTKAPVADAYLAFLESRDGDADLARRTLSRREAFFDRLALEPVRSHLCFDRDTFLRCQGMPSFTANTITEVDRLDHELYLLSLDDLVVEHGEFRDDVTCAAHLVGTTEPERPTWAVVVSCHGHDLPAGVGPELARAAQELAAGPVATL